MCKNKNKKARSSSWGRSQAYGEIKSLGTRLAAEPAFSPPVLAVPEGLRPGFLDRALDADTGKLVAKTQTFGSRYRSTHDAQDELLSTASTRHFIQGLLQGRSKDEIPEATWTQWRDAIDLISRLRIPTKFSGFATASVVMQHPTEPGEGVFSTESVYGPHGSLDSARVQYVGMAVKLAREAGESASEQFLRAARAAIEFSLNYFTAPITASNVQPFSAKTGVDHADSLLQEQLASRERIKDIYVKLGGKLRDLVGEETLEESWARPWQSGLTMTNEAPHPVAPPSPLRVATRKRDRYPEPGAAPAVAAQSVRDAFGDSLFDETALPNPGDFPWENVAGDELDFSLYRYSPLTEDDSYATRYSPSAPREEESYLSLFDPSAPPEEESYLSLFSPSAPSEEELYLSLFSPSAPPLSESPFAQDMPDSASSADYAPDDPLLTDDPLSAFDLQTGEYGNLTNGEFGMMFPAVPTQVPGEFDEGEAIPGMSDSTGVAADGDVVAESAGEGAGELVALLA